MYAECLQVRRSFLLLSIYISVDDSRLICVCGKRLPLLRSLECQLLVELLSTILLSITTGLQMFELTVTLLLVSTERSAPLIELVLLFLS